MKQFWENVGYSGNCVADIKYDYFITAGGDGSGGGEGLSFGKVLYVQQQTLRVEE